MAAGPCARKIGNAQAQGRVGVSIAAAGHGVPGAFANGGSARGPIRRVEKPMAKKKKKKKTVARKAKPRNTPRRWSGDVTRHSFALDLEEGVFTLEDPARIAASLKRSAERSRRRKAEPYRSALSMLTFYINRAGRNLPAARRRVLEQAKVQLRKQFGRE
jgi:hypothetical protein